MKCKRILCIVLALLFLPACTKSSVSERTLEALRKDYPYDNRLSDTAIYNFSGMSSWEEYADRQAAAIQAIAVLEFSGEWYTKTIGSSPFEDASLQEKLPYNTLTGIISFATVERILYDNGSALVVGEEFPIIFGSTLAYNIDVFQDVYLPNQRYVCFLYKGAAGYQIENLYGVTKPETFYLTEKDVLLSMTDWIRVFDKSSGMYLDTFASSIEPYFPPPDAERTPVEPEVQVQ